MAITTAEPTTQGRGPTRVIVPRRALPNGRAIVGALLVTLATIASFAVATSGEDGPETQYLVVSTPIAAGDTVSLRAVTAEPMELSPTLITSALTTTAGLEGATALRDLRAGELLNADDLIAAHSIDGDVITNVHEITFSVPLDRTPPGIRRGDRVTILGTSADVTSVAVEDALVLSIDTQPDQIGSSGNGALTLAIDDAETVMAIAHVTQTAEITVVRSTRALADTYPPVLGTDQATP